MNPIYKPKEITSALSDINKIAESFDILEKKVEEDNYHRERSKGDKEISPFADPSSLL